MKNGYAIGSPDKEGYRIWFKPTFELANCVSQQGKTDKDVIFCCHNGEMFPYRKWNVSKWVPIELAKIKDSLIENIINMLRVLNYQLKSKSHDNLILFFIPKDSRHGVSIGVRIVGVDFIDNEKHDVRMAFTFSHNIIDVSTKELGWGDKSKFLEYEREILEVKKLIENKPKKIITLN